MSQLIVRNVPEEIVRALKLRAARRGRSAEAEHRVILEQALKKVSADFWSRADELRSETARRKSAPSEALLRRMRDER